MNLIGHFIPSLSLSFFRASRNHAILVSVRRTGRQRHVQGRGESRLRRRQHRRRLPVPLQRLRDGLRHLPRHHRLPRRRRTDGGKVDREVPRVDGISRILLLQTSSIVGRSLLCHDESPVVGDVGDADAAEGPSVGHVVGVGVVLRVRARRGAR